jgi:tetratricopeptide (TPR) repeat protein
MRTTLTAAALAAVALLGPAGSLWAGVYNTAEPAPYPLPSTFDRFQIELGSMRGVAVDVWAGDPAFIASAGGTAAAPQGPAAFFAAATLMAGARETLRGRYLRQVQALEAKGRTGELTAEDRLNLGAYYIRLLRYEEAARTLDAAAAEDPDNFMVLANLATANHLAGRLDRAIDYEQQALKAPPRLWAGISAEQIDWYRRAERYYLSLLMLRQQEERFQPGRPPATVDALFPGVRFVGQGGQYEAGTIAPEDLDRLPAERIPLVSQLTLWLPFDDRVYWLVGELLNAQGDVAPAFRILDDLVYVRNFAATECRAHRRVLFQFVDQAGWKLFGGPKGPAAKEQLLWSLALRGAFGAPPGGTMVNEVSWLAALDRLQGTDPFNFGPGAERPGNQGTNVVAADGSSGTGSKAGASPQPGSPPPAPWLPDWRTFLVGMGSGALLALLIAQQVRQSRRRAEQGAGVRKAG